VAGATAIRGCVRTRTYYLQLFMTKQSFVTRMKREFASLQFKIGSASDARSAYSRWMEKSTDHEAIRSLFEAKTAQLERIEAHMNESDRPGLTAIEPGSYFTATYVQKVARGWLEPRKYQVGFNVTYQNLDASSAESNATATNVQISPYPFSLSVVAIIAALFGVLLKLSLGNSQNPIQQMYAWPNLGNFSLDPLLPLFSLMDMNTYLWRMASAVR